MSRSIEQREGKRGQVRWVHKNSETNAGKEFICFTMKKVKSLWIWRKSTFDIDVITVSRNTIDEGRDAQGKTNPTEIHPVIFHYGIVGDLDNERWHREKQKLHQ